MSNSYADLARQFFHTGRIRLNHLIIECHSNREATPLTMGHRRRRLDAIMMHLVIMYNNWFKGTTGDFSTADLPDQDALVTTYEIFLGYLRGEMTTLLVATTNFEAVARFSPGVPSTHVEKAKLILDRCIFALQLISRAESLADPGDILIAEE